MDELELEVSEFEKESLDKLLVKIRSYYKDTENGSNLKVLTFKKIKFIITYLEKYRDFRGRLETSDQEILTKVKALLEEVESKAFSWMRYWLIEGDTFEQKLKNFPDEQLVYKLHSDWKAVNDLITLESKDAEIYKKLSDIIERLGKGESWNSIKGEIPAPDDTPVLTRAEVQDAIVAAAGAAAKPDDAVADSWTKFNNTKSKFATVKAIEDWIKENIINKKNRIS